MMIRSYPDVTSVALRPPPGRHAPLPLAPSPPTLPRSRSKTENSINVSKAGFDLTILYNLPCLSLLPCNHIALRSLENYVLIKLPFVF